MDLFRRPPGGFEFIFQEVFRVLGTLRTLNVPLDTPVGATPVIPTLINRSVWKLMGTELVITRARVNAQFVRSVRPIRLGNKGVERVVRIEGFPQSVQCFRIFRGKSHSVVAPIRHGS
jgi:hypothetical protein